jgi:hypothetical protein
VIVSRTLNTGTPTEAELLEQRILIARLLPSGMRDDVAIREMEAALDRLRRPRLVVVNPQNSKGDPHER